MTEHTTPKFYEVATTLYTLDGTDLWECLSFDQKPGEPAEYWFMNINTGDTYRGTIDELPDFQEVLRVSEPV